MPAEVTVSVCVPTRNHARYLEAAVRSALGQDVDGMEVLVHDDASTDSTADVLGGIGDDRLRVFRHPRPVGVAANRNSLLDRARGRHIAWLDSDDEYLPGSLAARLARLEDDPGMVLVHGAHQVIDEAGRRLPDWPAPFTEDVVEPSESAFVNLVASNELATSSVVVRGSSLRGAGRFRTDLGASSTDWEMWLRLSLRGSVGYCAEPMSRYRQHPATISRAASASGERLRCDVDAVEGILAAGADSIAGRPGTAAKARAALAAKALLRAGDAYTAAEPEAARAAIRLAGELAGEVPVADLLAATDARDSVGCQRLTQDALGALAPALAGTRFGARVARLARRDADWDSTMAAAAASVAARTPPAARIAVIGKWDGTVLARAGRRGCNYPDRHLLADGYPVDGAAAVTHLDQLRRVESLTHLVIPSVSAWWLEHYPELGARLGPPSWSDTDCAIYVLGDAA